MERNLESIVKEIAQNEELSKEFTAMDEIDEIYAYCKEMGLNSSEEEFDEEVSSIIDNFDIYLSQIDKNDLSLVAGGSMLDKNFNKVVASALSALTIAGAGAANSNFASASTVSVSASEKTQSAKNIKSSSKMEYTKEKFNEIKNSLLRFCKKYKIAVGVTTAAIILAAIYTGVAIHKGSANPRNWFGNADNSNSNHTDDDNTNDVDANTISAYQNALSQWVSDKSRSLDNLPREAYDFASQHSSEYPALHIFYESAKAYVDSLKGSAN